MWRRVTLIQEWLGMAVLGMYGIVTLSSKGRKGSGEHLH